MGISWNIYIHIYIVGYNIIGFFLVQCILLRHQFNQCGFNKNIGFPDSDDIWCGRLTLFGVATTNHKWLGPSAMMNHGPWALDFPIFRHPPKNREQHWPGIFLDVGHKGWMWAKVGHFELKQGPSTSKFLGMKHCPPVIKHSKLGNRRTRWRFIAGKINFSIATFDYRRVLSWFPAVASLSQAAQKRRAQRVLRRQGVGFFREPTLTVRGSLGALESGSLRAPERGSLGTPKSDTYRDIRDT